MKKIMLNILLILGIVCLTGCGLSNEEKQKREEYSAQAKENAIKYIENKYGFTPEIGTTKYTFDNSDNFCSSCNKEIIVNAKYNNKWFEVIIDGSQQTEKGIDNYQYDLIKNDLIKFINNDFGTSYKYQFYYGPYSSDIEGLIDIYYDGSNLQEIMEKAYLQGVVEYIDGNNFEDLQNKLTSSNYSIFKKLYVVNYKSLDLYKKAPTHEYGVLYSSGGSYFEEYFYDNSEYLKDVIVLFHKNIKYYDF